MNPCGHPGSTYGISFVCLRVADSVESQPWRRVRSVHGMLRHSGECPSRGSWPSLMALLWSVMGK
ncbi:hypothetical protein F3K43_32295 [Streptomyces sp. LBUM 1476]|nr:hypothetical protein [Streptomyces sp. LBUM 1476]